MTAGFLADARLTLILSARALFTPVAFGVAGLVLQQGRVALVRHSYSRGWHLPGGGLHRGEAAPDGLLRELHEEIGLNGTNEPDFFGLYVRTKGLVTNHIAVYRIEGGQTAFKPNWEIRDLIWADPVAPPPDTAPGTARRLAEFCGTSPRRPDW